MIITRYCVILSVAWYAATARAKLSRTNIFLRTSLCIVYASNKRIRNNFNNFLCLLLFYFFFFRKLTVLGGFRKIFLTLARFRRIHASSRRPSRECRRSPEREVELDTSPSRSNKPAGYFTRTDRSNTDGLLFFESTGTVDSRGEF